MNKYEQEKPQFFIIGITQWKVRKENLVLHEVTRARKDSLL
jgi:hypothetical protein